ncbi:MAG: dehydrogenase, short-chain alcohol dehydrogenase like [Thermoleophilia bacterium]|nr:dehydrogenase, short-chain alcohol dehydrogenase like [Thermoleophilia bacterium]
MGRILVTGSADGLGLQSAHDLIDGGHDVWLHARSAARAADARAAEPRAAGVLVGDFGELAQVATLADDANAVGTFDAVINNAGIYINGSRVETVDGNEQVLQVNVLAPYLLTALMHPPGRLVYLSSGMHASGVLDFDDLQRVRRPWSGSSAYSDSKLLDVVLAFAVAQRWPGTRSNAVDPGWAATKMGGSGAPVSVRDGAATQVWLAGSDEPEAAVSGCYFSRKAERAAHVDASDPTVHQHLLDACADLTGVAWPEDPVLSAVAHE